MAKIKRNTLYHCKYETYDTYDELQTHKQDVNLFVFENNDYIVYFKESDEFDMFERWDEVEAEDGYDDVGYRYMNFKVIKDNELVEKRRFIEKLFM